MMTMAIDRLCVSTTQCVSLPTDPLRALLWASLITIAVYALLAAICFLLRMRLGPAPMSSTPTDALAGYRTLQTMSAASDLCSTTSEVHTLRRLEFARWCVQHGILTEFPSDEPPRMTANARWSITDYAYKSTM
jgi:hypothetical protein